MTERHYTDFALLTMVALIVTGCSVHYQKADFKQLAPPESPNWYLVCPPDYCNTKPSILAPVYPQSLPILSSNWQKLINETKNVDMFYHNDTTHLYAYIIKTALFKFPDTVTVKLMPLGQQQSTLAIYSQSQYGYYDFGANRRRVHGWLDKLALNAQ